MVDRPARCRACRRHACRRARRCVRRRRPAICASSATPTRPSTSSAPSTRSTASRDWFNDRSATPSTHPTSWCSKPSFPKTPSAAAAACTPSPLRSSVSRSTPVGLVPRHDAPGDQRRPVAGHAGRQRRRHGPSPRRRSRRQAGRGPRNASSSSSTCSASMPPPPAPPQAQPGDAAADGQPVEVDGRDAGGLEARRPERLRAHARPAARRARRTPIDDVHRAECALGATGSRAACRRPARCSSRSAPAISPARTASCVQLAERGIHSDARQLTALNLLFRAPSTRARASPAMVIPGGVAGHFL